MEAAKRSEIAQAAFRRNSIPGLAAAWSQALAAEGRNSPDDDVDAIRRVTVADVNRVARQFLIAEQFDHGDTRAQAVGRAGVVEGLRRRRAADVGADQAGAAAAVGRVGAVVAARCRRSESTGPTRSCRTSFG